MSKEEIEQRRSGAIYTPIALGYYPSLEAAKISIEANQSYMHEGNYYTYLSIEHRNFGLENYDFDFNPIWYKGYSTGNGWYDYEYRKCKKPACFNGIFFS